LRKCPLFIANCARIGTEGHELLHRNVWALEALGTECLTFHIPTLGPCYFPCRFANGVGDVGSRQSV